MKRLGGFTLIEAIVAMVIFTTAAMGIYSWINTNLISLQRIETIAVNERIILAAVELLQKEDLQVTEGKWVIDNYEVQWSAKLIEPRVNGVTPEGVVGLYDFGFYEIKFLLTEQGRARGEYSIKQVNSRKVRELEYE